MRTPGHDEELALGFCLSEGIAPVAARPPADLAANTVEVDAPGFDPARLRRSFYTSSSCGVCGKGALEAVAVEAPRRRRGLARPGRRSSPRSPIGSARPGRLCRDGRDPRDRPLRPRRPARLRARGRRPPQRDGQGRRLGVRRGSAAAHARASSASADGSRSSSSRRLRSPAARSSSRSARRRAWRSSSLPTAASRSAASSATAGQRLLEPWRLEADRHPPRRGRVDPVRIAEGARPPRR